MNDIHIFHSQNVMWIYYLCISLANLEQNFEINMWDNFRSLLFRLDSEIWKFHTANTFLFLKLTSNPKQWHFDFNKQI